MWVRSVSGKMQHEGFSYTYITNDINQHVARIHIKASDDESGLLAAFVSAMC